MNRPNRARGEVYWFDFFPEDGGRHMVVVVSRNTGREAVLAAFITTAQQPIAVDIVPITADFDCYPTVRGFVRCDRLFFLNKDQKQWSTFVTTLSDADMERIGFGLRAALQI